MRPFLLLGLLGLASTLTLCSLAGCGSSDNASQRPGGAAAGASEQGGTGTDLNVDPAPTPTGPDRTDTRDLPMREKTCDANGKCSCLRLALLGTLDSAANAKDTKPFMDWLNGKSEGTATVTMVSSKPTIDSGFLAKYDILLVANVNTWSFSADEKAAVAKWVRETGGGIVAVTGFLSTDTEPSATSQLIDFAGFRYEPPKTAEGGQGVEVYYKGDSSKKMKNCLAWTQSSDAIITTPIHFQPQSGSMAKLTYALDYVGAYIGWSVVAPSGATVVAKDPVSGSNMAVAYEIDGKGRIFAFGDEWVIFANQWVPSGDPPSRQQDQYNVCWHMPDGTSDGFYQSVQTLYQTKQFWYDAINWVAPPNECNFIVSDPDVEVPEIK